MEECKDCNKCFSTTTKRKTTSCTSQNEISSIKQKLKSIQFLYNEIRKKENLDFYISTNDIYGLHLGYIPRPELYYTEYNIGDIDDRTIVKERNKNWFTSFNCSLCTMLDEDNVINVKPYGLYEKHNISSSFCTSYKDLFITLITPEQMYLYGHLMVVSKKHVSTHSIFLDQNLFNQYFSIIEQIQDITGIFNGGFGSDKYHSHIHLTNQKISIVEKSKDEIFENSVKKIHNGIVNAVLLRFKDINKLFVYCRSILIKEYLLNKNKDEFICANMYYYNNSYNVIFIKSNILAINTLNNKHNINVLPPSSIVMLNKKYNIDTIKHNTKRNEIEFILKDYKNLYLDINVDNIEEENLLNDMYYTFEVYKKNIVKILTDVNYFLAIFQIELLDNILSQITPDIINNNINEILDNIKNIQNELLVQKDKDKLYGYYKLILSRVFYINQQIFEKPIPEIEYILNTSYKLYYKKLNIPRINETNKVCLYKKGDVVRNILRRLIKNVILTSKLNKRDDLIKLNDIIISYLQPSEKGGIGTVKKAELNFDKHFENLGVKIIDIKNLSNKFNFSLEDGKKTYEQELCTSILVNNINSPYYQFCFGGLITSPEDEGYIFIEFIDGIPLNKIIENSSINEIDYLYNNIKQVFLALLDGQNYGFTHYDLHTENILVLRQECENISIKIIDFGWAHIDGNENIAFSPQKFTYKYGFRPDKFNKFSDIYTFLMDLYYRCISYRKLFILLDNRIKKIYEIFDNIIFKHYTGFSLYKTFKELYDMNPDFILQDVVDNINKIYDTGTSSSFKFLLSTQNINNDNGVQDIIDVLVL